MYAITFRQTHFKSPLRSVDVALKQFGTLGRTRYKEFLPCRPSRYPIEFGQGISSAFRSAGKWYIPHPVPVGKASYRIHILAAGTVEQGHGRFAQHKGIFREGLVLLGTDIAIRFLRPVKELGGKDFHAAIQGKTVKGWTFQESHNSWGSRWQSEYHPTPEISDAHPGHPAPTYPPYARRSEGRCPPVLGQCGREISRQWFP